MGKFDAPADVSVRRTYGEDKAEWDRSVYGVWPAGHCPRCGADPASMKARLDERDRLEGREKCPSIGREWQCPLPKGHEGHCL
jgi:hypothetical protein